MLSVEIKPASNGIYGVCRVAEGTLTHRCFTLLLLHIASRVDFSLCPRTPIFQSSKPRVD